MSDLFEDRLREALRQEGDAVRPGERLDEIRAAARRRRPWALPMVAAATVLVLAVAVWLAVRPAAPPFAVPYKMLSPNGPMSEVVLPVYYVAPLAPGSPTYALFRDESTFWLPYDATPTDRANYALTAAMAAPNPNPNGAITAWNPGTRGRVVAHPGLEVDVEVSTNGKAGLPDRVQELAVQALVWTVTEVLGDAYAPVQLYVATGGGLFETKLSNIYRRPGSDALLAQELAPIAVEPLAGHAPQQGDVVVRGTACTTEQNVLWELYRGGTRVSQGHTSAATASCPKERGAWSVSLGTLPAGDYEFRALEPDVETGRVQAQVSAPFSVG